MGKETITFDNIEIEKPNFYHYKTPIFYEDTGFKNILVPNKISSGENNYKYFIGYLHDDYKIEPLHIMPPKTSAYVKSYDVKTKWMCF